MPFGRVLLSFAAAAMLLNAQASDPAAPEQIRIGDSIIDLGFAPGHLELSREQIRTWIVDAAEAVAEYFGRFPLAHARILVRPVPGRQGVFRGTTWGNRGSGGAFTRISIGEWTTPEQLARDWMMTHELTHMAFPDIAGESREHHWIEEGMATYIEPIARAQSGQLAMDQVWSDMIRFMPRGLPRDGDEGLDHTHTWGRTYWGGALYWLLADVEIRERTQNRKGLEDAMRAIMNAGGTQDHEWPIEHVLETGDRAVGSSVLEDLYNRMRDAPVHTDLDGLWRRLGVRANGERVTYDDRAPLASVRKAITAPVSSIFR